ncbi:hypothetical protein PsalMR5_04874 (plasmid) [Piscirickettsia salmonis]|uniref:hypothetical protein n=1 Tax=Piscirickettsia salmonis TaxID=1238 RepID=UPI0012BA6886|nr:hypothetical protein [Piscirickettsia salmonis]QGP57355.1 hypothetical protein PsalSR1_04844 [Piscirickettsia salmonis]QGP66949.1 hypothetical protein PsalMR5_04874 [Piscirickettsia salmonis]
MSTDKFMPPLLIEALIKFYAYTNATQGVRHGGSEQSGVTEYDAELALHMTAALIRTIILREK